MALGDSFTEGLDDPYPGGRGFRGWADLVAGALATDGFRYANLAVRGRLFRRVVDEQLPQAVAMRPDLVSFAAGVNDALRRGFDPPALALRYDDAIGRLHESGAEVLLFRFRELSVGLPGQRLIGPRLAALNRMVDAAADRYGAIVVDLGADHEFANPALWSADRLHLNPAGHHRVAAHVLTILGLKPEPSWWHTPPYPPPVRWLRARSADLAWAGRHLMPWLRRRLAGRSSGDGVVPKRPTLAPITPLPPGDVPPEAGGSVR